MSDDSIAVETLDNPIDELRARTRLLESEFSELRKQSDARLIRAEVKAEAMRIGMIDLDCLQFLDLSAIKLNEKGEVIDAGALVSQLKRLKPWLFSAPSSSSLLSAPSAQPPRQKHATEMTDTEYASARAALLKHHY